MPHLISHDIGGLAARPALADSLRRCARALDLFHTQRGDPSVDVERLLSDDPSSLKLLNVIRRRRIRALS
jgi:hypothetical protein